MMIISMKRMLPDLCSSHTLLGECLVCAWQVLEVP